LRGQRVGGGSSLHAPALAVSLAVLLAGASPSASLAGSLLGDGDGDRIDDILDNCRDVANPDQTDTDLDGCGNACDTDYDNNGKASGASDFNWLRSCFGLAATVVTFRGPCAPVDANNDGKIGGVEFNTLRNLVGRRSGPSLSPLRKPGLCRAF